MSTWPSPISEAIRVELLGQVTKSGILGGMNLRFEICFGIRHRSAIAEQRTLLDASIPVVRNFQDITDLSNSKMNEASKDCGNSRERLF